jgi:hypothetical protein
MKKVIFLLVLLLQISLIFGQKYNEEYGAPIIVLVESDPWLMVIGSDVPTFALYENGQIIYKKIVNKEMKYFEVKYSREGTQKIIKTFKISDSLMRLPKSITTSYLTDQPTNEMILNFDSVKQISVYGNLRGDDSKARVRTPKSFLTVYDNLIKFDDTNSKEWLPDTFEVMATAYSYSPEKPIMWSKDWSDLKSSSTVKRNDDLYSIYLDKKYFPDFIKLLKNLKEKQAVEINGEKFSLSYRFPFPNLR